MCRSPSPLISPLSSSFTSRTSCRTSSTTLRAVASLCTPPKKGKDSLDETSLPHIKAIKPHEQPPPNWRDTTMTVRYKRGKTRHHHNYRPMCSIPHLVQNSKVSSSSSDYNSRWTPTSPGFRRRYSTTDHLFTIQRFRQSHRVAPVAVGRSHRLQKSHPTQLSTTALGSPQGSKASRNHTYSYSQSPTSNNNEHQCTLTLKANTFTSSEEPSRKTRSARCCSIHSCNTS